MDGELDKEKIVFDTTAVDFSAVGAYNGGVVGSIKDSSDNEGTVKINVIIYDVNNQTAPTLTIKEGYRTVKKDEDTSKINWGGDFVEAATDKDGLDLKSKVTADLSELDTTTAGTYNVELSVVDYAGNEVAQTIEVVVE